MSRPGEAPRLVRVLVGASLATAVLAGCGDAQPTTARASGAAGPSTGASAAPTGQPTGAAGVTVDVANYAAYADQPVVLSWKRTIEAAQASSNLRQVQPRVRAAVAPRLRAQIVAGLKQAWANGWTVRARVEARIASVTGDADSERLTACVWGPSYGYYDPRGAFVGDAQQYWLKIAFDLTPRGTDWIIDNAQQTGTCPGGAPQ